MCSKVPSGGGVTPLAQPVLPWDEMTHRRKWNSTSSTGSSTGPGALCQPASRAAASRLGWPASLGPGTKPGRDRLA